MGAPTLGRSDGTGQRGPRGRPGPAPAPPPEPALAPARPAPARRAGARRGGPPGRAPRRGGAADPGPAGSGKTYTGARMIAALVGRRKKVGVVANSHKVIGNLLEKVAEEAPGLGGRGAHRAEAEDATGHRRSTVAAASPTQRGRRGGPARRRIDVVGAVAWTWAARDGAPEPVLDVLFVDEAGQMSLANVARVCAGGALDRPARRSPAARPADPGQPTRRAPSGAPSATSSATGRRSPRPDGPVPRGDVAAPPGDLRFTSEAFYAGRLRPHRRPTSGQALRPHGCSRDGPPLDGAGIRYVPVTHAGNETDSPEEAARDRRARRGPARGSPRWTDPTGDERAADVDDVIDRGALQRPRRRRSSGRSPRPGMPRRSWARSTSSRARRRPVSIYAMGTSAPEDAPRGMEFLYSLNRLNVADVAGALRRRRRVLPGAAPRRLPHAAPDAARQRPVPAVECADRPAASRRPPGDGPRSVPDLGRRLDPE